MDFHTIVNHPHFWWKFSPLFGFKFKFKNYYIKFNQPTAQIKRVLDKGLEEANPLVNRLLYDRRPLSNMETIPLLIRSIPDFIHSLDENVHFLDENYGYTLNQAKFVSSTTERSYGNNPLTFSFTGLSELLNKNFTSKLQDFIDHRGNRFVNTYGTGTTCFRSSTQIGTESPVRVSILAMNESTVRDTHVEIKSRWRFYLHDETGSVSKLTFSTEHHRPIKYRHQQPWNNTICCEPLKIQELALALSECGWDTSHRVTADQNFFALAKACKKSLTPFEQFDDLEIVTFVASHLF